MIRREVKEGDILKYEIPIEIETAWVSEKRTIHVELLIERIEGDKVSVIWGTPAISKP